MKYVLMLLVLFGCVSNLRYGTTPYPGEYLPVKIVEMVWPLDDGHFLALHGDWSCVVEIDPLKIEEGRTQLACRWHIGDQP